MDTLDYILIFLVVVVILGLVYLYNQVNTINSSINTQLTSITSLTASNATGMTALTANTNAIAAIQASMAARNSTTSLTTVNSTLTPTFGAVSTSNVSSATCTSVYTAISTTMSECLNTITVTPGAANLTTLVQIPINIGTLTSISQVIILSLVGQSDSNAENVNNLSTPVIDTTNNVIQVKFTANSTSAHIIYLGLRLE